MGKQGVTVRGKAWERKNSLWIIWAFFACAGVGFLMTGRKIKEKKWIIIGIAYLVALWGGFWLQGILGEGSAAETVVMIWCVIYIASIVHCFIVKNQYLKKLDLVMNEQEINLEEERIQREKEKLEMQKKLDAERLQREKEMIEQQKKAELDKERMLQELEQKRKENERLSQDIEEKNVAQDNKEQTKSVQTEEKQHHENEIPSNDNGLNFKQIIQGIVGIVILIVCISNFAQSCGIGTIENAEIAERECGRKLTNNVFVVTPQENQVDIEAIDGKDGMVVVRVKIEDEDLLQYSIYGEDVDEIYFGYVPTTNTSTYYSYWGKSEDDIKEQMGW